ncbi:hypothetical protein M430DRAFT_34556 [Amorphotheca resinae ATCC 22711]|uniref:Uncharacterized protein n=1 Tax=Amorphotheca resinae ATCC 22711 TaxID=857342 RepID=A0A2T3B3I2_AMORE|nr:hypothetical protein M430DRAFT_34556 [Amorphotheca resinae ATCC 22711]PSS20204.1 hypothetical protein M430DRAFT_34556 [Amorphotheca resinae ATCC 22711]
MATLPRRFVHDLKVALGPHVTAPNTLNPVLLAIGIRGYWIQSRIFRIPDRYGFFSLGPARLQVHDASLCIAILMVLAVVAPAVVLFHVCLTLKDGYRPLWKDALIGFAPSGLVFSGIWIWQCHSKQRAPDYEWEDWKTRKD